MINLSTEDSSFLLKTLELPKHLREALTPVLGQTRIEISSETADELRELCLDRYDIYGLNEEYEATPEGKKLDNLIDKLFTG